MILGPYGGEAPSLLTFAPHAWRAQFCHVAVAGQFMQLPHKVPPSWGPPGQARAYAVFEFSEVRRLKVDGFLSASEEDDSMHGKPCGVAGDCSLIGLPNVFFENPDNGVVLPLKRFNFSQASFSISLEAGSVMLYCGRRASSQFGQWNAV